jgi:hypothetical protein
MLSWYPGNVPRRPIQPLQGGPTHPPFPPNPPTDHAEMIARLDALERGMTQLGVLPATIGHNRPPEDDVLSVDDRNEIADAIATLKAQPPEPATRPPEAVHAFERLAAAAQKVAAYLLGQTDPFIEAYVKAAGAELGKRSVQLAYWVVVAHLMNPALQAVVNWLHSLTPAP